MAPPEPGAGFVRIAGEIHQPSDRPVVLLVAPRPKAHAPSSRQLHDQLAEGVRLGARRCGHPTLAHSRGDERVVGASGRGAHDVHIDVDVARALLVEHLSDRTDVTDDVVGDSTDQLRVTLDRREGDLVRRVRGVRHSGRAARAIEIPVLAIRWTWRLLRHAREATSIAGSANGPTGLCPQGAGGPRVGLDRRTVIMGKSPRWTGIERRASTMCMLPFVDIATRGPRPVCGTSRSDAWAINRRCAASRRIPR
jgi:hypothetical protein